MKDLNERSEFDREWRGVFEGAEAEPSDDVWMRVDAFLANNEAKKYKTRAFYYKWAAAASLAIAAGIALYAVLNQNITGNEQTAAKEAPVEVRQDNGEQGSGETPLAERKKSKDNVGAVAGEHSGAESVASGSATGTETGAADKVEGGGAFASAEKTKSDEKPDHVALADNDDSPADADQGVAAVLRDEEDVEETLLAYDENEVFANLALAEKRGAGSLDAEMYPEKGEINRVTDLSDFFIEEKKESQNLWAGLSFGTGFFDPDFSSSSAAFAAPSSFSDISDDPKVIKNITKFWNSVSYDYTVEEKNVADGGGGTANRKGVPVLLNEESYPDPSFSLGFSMGARISEKIVLESGLFYSKNMTSSSTNYILVDEDNRAYPLHISNSPEVGDGFITQMEFAETPINVNYNFISIPVKAGYVALDKQVGIIVFGGIGSDLFISNNVTDNEGFEDVTVRSGSDSPYKTLLFNALLSTQIKYDLDRGRYSLYVEPTYRMSLNNFTKASYEADYHYASRPRAFNVNVGLKYNFD